MIATRDPEIDRAYGVLKHISTDKGIRLQFEAREKLLRDERARIKDARLAGMELGRAEGKAEGMRVVAEKMLALNLPQDVIAQATGLSMQEIEALHKI